jgi:hypothetical protein
MRPAWMKGLVALAGLALVAGPGGACSLCDGNVKLAPTFRQEAATPMARLILHGTIANPRTTGAGLTGQTDFHIKAVLRPDPAVKGKTVLVLPRYLPVNEKEDPPHWLLFCDVEKGKIDPYRGVRINGPATVEYVKKALALKDKDTAASLEFYFRYLDDPDPEVSRDAFLEFAKAGDADVARAAAKLDARKLRAWIADPKTPPQQLGVYALLLGACGQPADADFLRRLLDSKEERYVNAADGLLAGYLQKKPREGWELAQRILADGRQSLLLRLAVLRALRFYQGAQPKESRPQVLRAMRTLLAQGELADLAVEDLRRWKVWDLTAEVLKVYGRKGYDAPLMRRAVIRYALCCEPTRESKEFLAARRAAEPDLVKDVEEGLKYEKGM